MQQLCDPLQRSSSTEVLRKLIRWVGGGAMCACA
jgi:hypothetical protein